GPLAKCTTGGGCICVSGYEIPTTHLPTGDSYGCVDIDECVRTSGICGSYSECENTIGAYICTCWTGFSATDPSSPPGSSNLCKDVDECFEDATVCGPDANCTNSIGSYSCTCFPGFRLNEPDVIASVSNPCTDIDECSETPGICGRQTVCTNVPGTFYCSCPDGFYPSTGIPAPTMVRETLLERMTVFNIYTPNMGASCQVTFTFMPGPKVSQQNIAILRDDPFYSLHLSVVLIFRLFVEDVLSYIMWTLPGSAAAAFLTLNGMESLLSHQYFQTENKTEMYSDVFTAVLPAINNTNLTEPVNFTIQHKKVHHQPKSEDLTCVYWEEKRNNGEHWSVEGCWVAYSDENYTVCSCSHLSTFALIMQIGEPPPEDPFLEWLNRVCVIVGLFFFGLAIFTFLLCSWNPKINNTARLHIYLEHELACTVMAGLLHFLVVASFVWMLLEALQLHLLVRRLSKVQVIQRDGLPRPLLYVIGYGVPFVIVGVSALVYSDGYGATEGDACWLSTKRLFNWALTGPVIVILGLNWVLFLATLWSLRPTLANMRSDISQSKDTRLILFKIVAQFVILGCTWILGLYQSNLFFQVLFIILNSQQGTFLFIVHCLLNKEVREEYIKWLTCSVGKDGSVVSP
uniref:Adhesion G protein-coupled receptor E8 n=1 Tax=Sparus aurata TaxID=8175 RepID=A0A671X0A5_SPAAU